MKQIQDIENLEGKKVLVRVDYNVPLDKGKVTDDERIVASLETINYLVEKNAAVILCSHLGRPKGEDNKDFSLEPVAPILEKLIKKSVQFVSDCVGEPRDNAVSEAKNCDVLLLENVRFYPEEEANDSLFAQKLARGCDYYVNDAFSASHRTHASIVGVTDYLPSYAGFSLEKEVDNLGRLLDKPEKPFVFISGGAKVSDKIGVLENLVQRVDVMLVGGGMANTFLDAEKCEIGCSLYEDEMVPKAREIIQSARANGVRLVLPTDVVITRAISENARALNVDIEEVGEMDIIADIGERTVANFEAEIAKAGTIFWNGPLGVAEYAVFAKATLETGRAVANAKAFSVIGGGDTIAALPEEDKNKFNFVSMAGGASMEFLAGKTLPGLAALE